LVMWESEEIESRFRLAYATLKSGDNLAAKQDLKELLSIDASHVGGRVLLAQLHCNNGEIAQCHLEANRVLKLDKYNRLAKTLINQSNKSKNET